MFHCGATGPGGDGKPGGGGQTESPCLNPTGGGEYLSHL
jgi:hypothetical protein